MSDILTLAHGTVWKDNTWQRLNIIADEGKIIHTHESKTDGIVFDMHGLNIIPGGIDPHVHLREPGMTHKEDMFTGGYAAAHGGYTCILDMPNTKPPTTSLKALFEKQEIALEAPIDIKFFLGADAENLHVIQGLEKLPEEQKPVGVKVYFGNSTGDLLFDDIALVKKIFSVYTGITVFHAELESRMKANAKKFKKDSVSEHNKIRDPECASQATEDILNAIPRGYKGRVHFAHVSTRLEMDLIRKAKKEGLPVTCEVTPHHLFLSESDLKRLKNSGKVNPPLRSKEDQEALFEGIYDGTIDCLATDHAPHLLEEKGQSYSKAPSGVPGVETALALLCKAEHEKRLTWELINKLRYEKPKELFGLDIKDAIEIGAPLDVAVIDLHTKWKIRNSDMLSKCHWTPFEGWEVPMKVAMTILRGKIVFRDFSYELPLLT